VIVRNTKNPGLAAVLSFLLCGLGQVYNGQILKGLLFLFIFGVSIPLAAFGIGWLTGGAMWLAGVFDAYHTAQRLNRETETPSN
jgi:TM2 domain-containing membrane protein YozV